MKEPTEKEMMEGEEEGNETRVVGRKRESERETGGRHTQEKQSRTELETELETETKSKKERVRRGKRRRRRLK